MKKLPFILTVFLLLAFSACSEIVIEQEEVAAKQAVSSLAPSQIFLMLDSPAGTKALIGGLDNETNAYPLTLEENDMVFVYGIDGDTPRGELIDDYYPNISNATCLLTYVVKKVAGDKSALNLESSFFYDLREDDAFAATKSYVVLSSILGGFGLSIQAATSYVENRLAPEIVPFANKFTAEQFESFRGKWEDGNLEDIPDDSFLPVHVLSSVIRFHLDPSKMKEDFVFDVCQVQSNNYNSISGGPDMSRFDQILTDRCFYPDPDISRTGFCYADASVRDILVPAGESRDVYVGIAPGTYSDLELVAKYSFGNYSGTVKKTLKQEVALEPGKVYDVTFELTDEVIARHSVSLSPTIAVGNQSFYCIPGFTDFTGLDYSTNLLAFAGLLNAGVEVVPISGPGNESDFDGSVAGKIALIQRGTISFYLKVENACKAGAVGVIIYNNQPGTINASMSDMDINYWIPSVTVPQEFYTAFTANPAAKLSIVGLDRLFNGGTQNQYVSLGGFAYPMTGNKCTGYTEAQSLSAVTGLLEQGKAVELVERNDFEGIDLAGKIALLEFVPLQGVDNNEVYSSEASSAVQVAKAKGAIAVIIPGSYCNGILVRVPDIDCDIPCVTMDGRFPAHLKYVKSGLGEGNFSLADGGSLDDIFNGIK